MTETLCATEGCGYPAHDALCCRICCEQLERDLGDVPALAQELEVMLSRQARMSDPNGSRATERPLMFDPRASECLWLLRDTLNGWALAVAGEMEPHPVNHLPDLARWLLARADDLLRHPDAGKACEEVRFAVQEALRVIDRPADRIFAGICGADLRADAHPAFANECCPEPLYGHPGRDRVVCPGCGADYSVDERRTDMLATLDDMLFTAGEIAMLATYLGALADRQWVRKMLNIWSSRRTLQPRGTNLNGDATYRFGDAVQKILNMQRRAG